MVRPEPSPAAKVSEPKSLELSFLKNGNGQVIVDYDPLRRIKDERGRPMYFHAAVRIDAIGGRDANNPSGVEVRLYWATGPTILGLAARLINPPTKTVSRLHNKPGDVIHFYFESLESRQPGRATHLVAIIDPTNRLVSEETNRANNVGSRTISSAGDLAAQMVLFASRDIKFATTHVSRMVDQASAYQNITDVKLGRKARRSAYKDGNLQAPGGSTDLDVRMLTAMLELTKNYTFQVSEIAGGAHSSNSRHYAGLAFDVNQINGMPVSASNPHVKGFIALATKLGATEILKPGDPGHNTHVHLAWSRVPELV